MKYLVDTHVLVWWKTGSKQLSVEHRRVLRQAERHGERVGVSAVSLWEIAMLADRGRLRLEGTIEDYLETIESSSLTTVLPLGARIAAETTRLGTLFPRDPFDRIIASTARCHALTLLTADNAIRESKVVAVL